MVWKLLSLLANLKPSSCHSYPKTLLLFKKAKAIFKSREGQLIGPDECDDQPDTNSLFPTALSQTALATTLALADYSSAMGSLTTPQLVLVYNGNHCFVRFWEKPVMQHSLHALPS